MEKLKAFSRSKSFRIIKVTFLTLLAVYVVLVIWRAFVLYEEGQTAVEVERIHNTKLTLEDVMGENLPPDPGPEADETVEGVDANDNGIRDDVELAIFAKYPDSAKTRAVLLQYALALQMQMTLDILNKNTYVATLEELETSALSCIWSIFSRDDMESFKRNTEAIESFVEDLQINTKPREEYIENLSGYLDSYSFSQEGCDLDLSTLSN